MEGFRVMIVDVLSVGFDCVIIDFDYDGVVDPDYDGAEESDWIGTVGLDGKTWILCLTRKEAEQGFITEMLQQTLAQPEAYV